MSAVTQCLFCMNPLVKLKYEKLSDREVIGLIIQEPYDDDAATYLIYDRYVPLCKSICISIFNNLEHLDEIQSELFIHLKGSQRDWQTLKSFQWRSKLSTWLKIIVYNLSLELRNKFIENDGKNTSLDEGWEEDSENHRIPDIPVNEERVIERRYDLVVLNEIIHSLENHDQSLVIIRRLQGYSSKEVAMMLQDYWNQNNIIRYNRQHEVVVPNSGYIDNLFKRGYEKVKFMYNSLDK